MTSQANISGDSNVVIQDVSDSTITINVNGEVREIEKTLENLKSLMTDLKANSVNSSGQSYAVEELTDENFDFLTGKSGFNEYLTRALIEEIGVYNPIAKKIFDKAESRDKQWEKVGKYSNDIKLFLENNFIGVIGLQLQKLFAIGKDTPSQEKNKNYLQNCLLLSVRTYQLITFSLISALWDHAGKTGHKPDEALIGKLECFFSDEFDLDLVTYFDLVRSLFDHFKANDIPFPIPEIEDKAGQLTIDSELQKATDKLVDIQKKVESTGFNLVDCFDAERCVALILGQFAFLTNYKMVSIKGISYDEKRNVPPKFIHNYSSLRIDRKEQNQSVKVVFADKPVSTDGIFLYKDHYKDGVNLFPFIIDYNSLKMESNSKICFYSSREFMDGSLSFRFIGDNKSENIKDSGVWKEGEDINQLLMEKENRIRFKLDSVVKQFKNAQATLTGITD